MDIKIWEKVSGFVPIDDYPKLLCPNCESEELKLLPDTIRTVETTETLLLRSSLKYQREKLNLKTKKQKMDEEYLSKVDGGFTLLGTIGMVFNEYQLTKNAINGKPSLLNAFLECEHCKTRVSCTGIQLQTSNIINNEPDRPLIKVEYFSPSIPVFPISPYIPQAVVVELQEAFKHFHFDPPSSASKLRRAIEKFCDDLELEGKNLNNKIQSFKKEYKTEGEYLDSLRLVGNEGTHGEDVGELDLLYAFQVFQVVLELYERNHRLTAQKENFDKLTEKYRKAKSQNLQLPSNPD